MAAIKEFPEGNNPKAWQRETNALQAIGRRNFPHVVDVRGFFTQGSKIYLVFPWADGGNLMDFWEEHNAYADRCHIATHFVPHIMRQLREIASALESLHDFKRNGRASYRHGDLKPENILVFRSQNILNDLPGTWKMSDLGLARMHEEVTGARYGMQATSMRGFGTTSYKPPEAFSKPNYPTTRLFDIWSMGCIILQLITWLVYGMEGVKGLTQRTHWGDKPSCFWTGDFQIGRGLYNLTVHDEVRRLMNTLKSRLADSPALFELLGVVENQLLVIETPHPRLPGVFRYRTDARGLYESLCAICQRCDQNPLYWSLSWKTIHGSTYPVQGQGFTGNAQRGGNVSPCLQALYPQFAISHFQF